MNAKLYKSFQLQKRLFQAILCILLTVPFGLGTVGVLFGLHGFYWIFGLPEPQYFEVNLDSDFRFLAGTFILVGILTVRYIIRDIENKTGLFRVIAIAIFIGGIGRLFSWNQLGKPSNLTIFLLAIELFVMPLLALWQVRLALLASKIEKIK